MAAPANDVRTDEGLVRFTEEEAAAIFDARARRHFGISGPEFVKRWKAGCYDHIGDERHYMAMLFALPLVGENPWQR